jgi:hypothetical protein
MTVERWGLRVIFRGCADFCVIWRGTAILAVFTHGLEAHATEFRTVPIFLHVTTVVRLLTTALFAREQTIT